MKNMSLGIMLTENAQISPSNLGLHYPLTESLDSTECMNEGQRPT